MPQTPNTTDTIRALTIKQPWASLIAAGEKRVENRSWTTRYRGPVAIHAGKGIDRGAGAMVGTLMSINSHPDHDVQRVAAMVAAPSIVAGEFVGVVDLVDVVAIEDLPVYAATNGLADAAWKPWAVGPWCWILRPVAADRRLLLPVGPVTGKLGLWSATLRSFRTVASVVRQ